MYILDVISTQEENDFDEMEMDFPIKDRSISRKHASSRRKAKKRDRNKKQIAYQRSADLYNSGLDRNGQTFKARSLSAFADLDEYDALKGNESHIINESKEADIFATCNSIVDVLKQINSLAFKGIYIDKSLTETAIKTKLDEDRKKAKRDEIYANRPLIGYGLISYSLISYGDIHGIYPDEATAYKVRQSLIDEAVFETEIEVKPIYGFTSEQVRELESLGFPPIGIF